MDPTSPGTRHQFSQELGLILTRVRQAWALVPGRHKLALGSATLVIVVSSACNIAIPVVIGWMVDRVARGLADGLDRSTLLQLTTLPLTCLLAAFLMRETLNVLRRFLVENACTRLDKDMTVKVVGHLITVDLVSLAADKVGALCGRVSRSVQGFVRICRISFLDFFPAVMTGVFALTIALSKQPWLGLVMVCVIPASVGLTIWQLYSQKNVRLKLIKAREDLDGSVVELLGGLDYVRAANTADYEVKRVEATAERRRAREIKHHFEMSLFGSGKAINEGLFHCAVLGLAVYLAIDGKISVGDIFAFSGLFLGVMSPLAEVHRVIDEGHECSLHVGNLIELLDRPKDRSFATPDHGSPVAADHSAADGVPMIRSEGLVVDYQCPDGKIVRGLDGLSLSIRDGETVGVVGRSGCGKSTWLKVLMRLTHPTAGRVWVKGVPIEDVSREAIGRVIGYVGQQPFVFSGTVAENIAYGCPDATPEQIRQAARQACIHDEILALPGGYDARVAERGSNLSGGQRQRLALARIFLKNPPILILDEATSALDTINEREVQRAIDAAREHRTVIIVAHRLSTLADADRILVFDDGRIVEEGSYAALVRQGGLFAELAECGSTDVTACEPSDPCDTLTALEVTQLAPMPVIAAPAFAAPVG